MKKLILILVLMLAGLTAAEAHRYNRGWHTISMQTFYEELSPYGEWNYTPQYGYVWRPWADENPDFMPYSTGGDWVYTDLGWTWVSEYRWGWAPFHYGRWTFDDRLGWCWVPGYEWAPAWVTWGTYNNCYAWAPLGPDVYVGVNTAWFAPAAWWTVVPYGHFCAGDWHRYTWNRPVVVNNITCITNIYNNYGDGRGHGYRNDNRNEHRGWYHGPRVNDVERVAGVKVRRMEVVESVRPGRTGVRNDRVEVYRPEVRNERGTGLTRTDPGRRQLPPVRENGQRTEVRERTTSPEYTRTERRESPAPVMERKPPVRQEVREAVRQAEGRTREQVRESERRSSEQVRQAPPAERTRPAPRVEPAKERSDKRSDIGAAPASRETTRQASRTNSGERNGR